MPVFVLAPVTHPPLAWERAYIDQFVATFVAKKGEPPAGHWKVPGVGYCVFYKDQGPKSRP